MSVPNAPLKSLPSTDRVLRSAQLAGLRDALSHDILVRVIREVLQTCREAAGRGVPVATPEEVAEAVVTRAAALLTSPRAILNATGVILHTNLGRAPLSRDALTAVVESSGYSDLEYDLARGERGSRQERAAQLLIALTGAEAAHIAVNNAAAVTLVLAALARGRDVVISRGQAVEIGGGVRVPVILRQSGARLVEVGTTNRTRLEDYEEALSPRTAALLHVHTSNFRLIGFTEDVAMGDLADLARRRGIPLIVDNGSGALIDTARFGLAHEPMPREALDAGADVVAFSGDKLLGGPQAGIVLGRAELVRRVASCPLARAVRPDKITLSALSATLQAYARGDAAETLPLWQMIAQDPGEIYRRACAWQERAAERGLAVELTEGESTVGGGSLPGETLATTLLVLPALITAAALRRGTPPVVARTHARRVLLDLRTVPRECDSTLLEVVVAALWARKSS